MPESLTQSLRKDLPKNRILKSQATQELGTLIGHRAQHLSGFSVLGKADSGALPEERLGDWDVEEYRR